MVNITILVALVCVAVATPLMIDPDTNMFVDATGRERFFHGLNVIQKDFPWYAPYEGFNVNTTFSDIDMANW
jgi:endoglycosylceramidase